MTLFTPTELKKWLHYADEADFVDEDAQLAEQVVAGWLADAADVDDVAELIEGDTPSSRVKAWAIELGGIAYENPTSMSSDQADEVGSSWQVDRRSQILGNVRAWARNRPGVGTPAAVPKGRFPSAPPWPDPLAARRR